MLSTLIIPLVIGQIVIAAQSARALGPIIEQYGVADDGTILTWQVFPAKGAGEHPNVLVIHGGGFSANPADSKLLACAKDLSAAGMNAFVIDYRLAPPGMLPGQKSDGRYPDQTNDVVVAIRAARADSRGNGKVGAVGGSAGGSHIVYTAANGTPGDDRVDAAVCLSGAYDYGDKTSWRWQQGAFLGWVSNYVDSTDARVLEAASPVSFIKGIMPPLKLYTSDSEPMPPQQLTDLVDQLESVRSRNYEQAVIPGRAHAFAYWNSISADAIDFLLPLLQN
ncbi:MAG TPA: alpha/beta hydrolase [Chthoniobacterales bacterium]